MFASLAYFVILLGVLVLAPQANGFTIEESMRRAAQGHPDVRLSQGAEAAARGRIAEAHTGLTPRVEAGLSLQRGYERTIEARAWRTRSDIFLSLRQAIWDGGVTRHNIGQAERLHRAARFAVSASQENVALGAANDYLEALILRNRIVHVRQTLERTLEVERIARQRAEQCRRTARMSRPEDVEDCANKANDFDYARERALNTRAELLRRQEEYSQAIVRYLGAIGERIPDMRGPAPQAEQTIGQRLRYPERLPEIPASPGLALEIAMRENPQVRGVGAEIEANEERRQGIDAQRRPRVEGYVVGMREAWNREETRSDSVVAGFQLTIPLYDGGLARAQQMQRLGDRQQLVARVEQFRLNANLALSRLYLFLDRSELELANIRQRIETLNELFHRRMQGYIEERSWIYLSDLLDSIESLGGALEEREGLTGRRVFAHYDIHLQLGSLLNRAAAVPEARASTPPAPAAPRREPRRR